MIGAIPSSLSATSNAYNTLYTVDHIIHRQCCWCCYNYNNYYYYYNYNYYYYS